MQIAQREVTVARVQKPFSHKLWKRIVVRENGKVALCTDVHASQDESQVLHEFDKLRKLCSLCGR